MTKAKLERLRTAIGGVLLGKDEVIAKTLACLLAEGHLLVEDLPGQGKTTLAKAISKLCGLADSRIQATSDLLPADILGVSIFSKQTQTFEFHKGPIFAEILLFDEINRTSPKTQSARLQAMEELTITVDRSTHRLPSTFFVIATQNPLTK